jgi:gluconokinase
MVLIVMGVAGSGKTTVGELLAGKLGWDFYDADRFHPKENIEKMSRGIPLTDEDRLPWLSLVRDFIAGLNAPAVIACSALKAAYRDVLKESGRDIRFVYLAGGAELVRERIEGRKGHFAGARILENQFEALEEPEDALREDIRMDPESIANDIIDKLHLC